MFIFFSVCGWTVIIKVWLFGIKINNRMFSELLFAVLAQRNCSVFRVYVLIYKLLKTVHEVFVSFWYQC